MSWEDKFGRWIKDDEIVIEFDGVQDDRAILNQSNKMAKVGYNLEYWKAPKQKSGHLHIKNILFPETLSYEELVEYRKLVIEKYSPYGAKPDLQLCSKHRIAEEGKPHYKGYGIKKLVKTWNETKKNICEKELYFKCKRIVAERNNERVVLANGSGITAKLVSVYSIVDIAKSFGFNPDSKGRCECLFHGGSNPTSLKLNDDTGTFFCFSCGIKGNLIDFIYEARQRGLKNGRS